MEEAALSHSIDSCISGSEAFAPAFYSAATLPEPVTSAFSYSAVPAWFRKIRAEVEALKLLPENWDSYGAPKLNRVLLGAALPMLAQVVSPKTPRPSVVPTSDGAVQFEWYTRGFEIQVRVVSSSKFHLSATDLRGVLNEVDSELDFDLRPLTQVIDELSARPT
jgi:hypothetical protein